MSHDQVNCVCDFEKVAETEDVATVNGRQVMCYGWDLKCRKCDTKSWLRNNEKIDQEEQERLWGTV